MSLRCVLLGREWRDGRRGTEVVLWGQSERGPVKVIQHVEPVFFVPRATSRELTEGPSLRRVEVPLRAMTGEPVDAIYATRQKDLVHLRERLREALQLPLESDVKPSERYLMERFVGGAFEVGGTWPEDLDRGVWVLEDVKLRALDHAAVPWAPRLTRMSIDIETTEDEHLLSVAMVTEGPLRAEGLHRERVFMVGMPRAFDTDATGETVVFVEDERALLHATIDFIQLVDPDLILGWNIVDFDLTVLSRRAEELGVPFLVGRHHELGRVLAGDRGQVSIARIPGRAVLDGIATLKNATWSFERYGLDFVAHALLGRRKRITHEGAEKVHAIARLAAEDPLALAEYNLEDARLVLGIFERARLVEFVLARSELVGLPLDRQGGSVAAFDHLVLPRLHRAGFVAPDVGGEAEVGPSPGGEVFEGVPGLHRDVLAFDFRSLYPTIMRTFAIDPLGLALATHAGLADADCVPGFDGARFAREGTIVPAIVDRLLEARARARSEGNEPLSRAIKILMNSLYGVMGTPGCRFYDARLASSITRRGHAIIHRARSFFEALGCEVLYGDTDSLFVQPRALLETPTLELAFELGTRLARELTATLAKEIARDVGRESILELRHDAYYARFLVPTMRHSEAGAKKRYAGLSVHRDGRSEVVIRGLEAARTDWTPFARRVQRELLERVFRDEPYEAWLRGVREELLRGRFDAELVYRKRIRRDLDAYGASPPHVRAARAILEETGEQRHDVEYWMTTEGPEPVSMRKHTIDHAHYVAKQLAPACDGVLGVLGTSFDAIAGAQLRLFE